MNETTQQLGFCAQCHSESSDDAPGNVYSFKGFGFCFYGGAEKCDTCGSVVRVLWAVFCHVPLIPMGTYLYQQVGGDLREGRFLARRTSTRWVQVLIHWMVTATVVCFALAFIDWAQRR